MSKNISIFDHVGNKAGMNYYSGSLAKGFVSQKHNCTVYSNFIGIDADKINYRAYYKGHSQSNVLVKFFKFISATIRSSFDARKEKSDLVIIHLFSANIITLLLATIPKLFGLKIAIISHDISSFINNDSSFIQNLIYNYFSDYIIVHNQFSYNELLQHVTLKNPDKVTIIKHGGYLDHINFNADKDAIRKSLELEVNGKYMLFFGQIKDVKGLDILIKAMATVPKDIKLIIAGKPWKSDFNKYDLLIKKYKLEDRIIKIIRFIEDDEREKLFFAADVNILPYRTIYQSGVLLMAMSHGLPVIASNLPANEEIIDDGVNGMLFESENSEALGKQITTFFQNDSLFISLSKKALQTIEAEYGWNKIAQSYLKLLDK